MMDCKVIRFSENLPFYAWLFEFFTFLLKKLPFY